VCCFVDSNVKPVAAGEPNATVTGYSHGLAVKTGLQLPSAVTAPDVVNQLGGNYLLTLPQRSLAGRCTRSAPVRFLVDSRDVCDLSVTSESCSVGSRLDAVTYAPSAGWGVATGPLVLGEQAVNRVAETNVNFLCVDRSTASSTVISARSVPPDTELCFATNDTCGVVGDCYSEPTTSAYVCPRDRISWSTPRSVPSSRCSFDGGRGIPPSPSFDAATGVCRNAAFSVEYNFTWSGQTIVHLNATVTLANISLAEFSSTTANSRAVLGQHFAVTFTGSRSKAADNNSSSGDRDMVSPLSGNPGESIHSSAAMLSSVPPGDFGKTPIQYRSSVGNSAA